MKVVHLFWSLGYGGIETMLVNIANEQAKQGVEVSILIVNDVVAEELRKKLSVAVNFVCIGRQKGSKSLMFLKQIATELDRLQPDVIHLHESVLYNYLPRRWRGIACCTLHAMPVGTTGIACRWLRLIQNLVFHQGGDIINLNRLERVFSISESVATALKDQFQINSTVVYNGIQTERFSIRENKLFGNKLRMVQVGRLEHYTKGQDLLIEAAAKLRDEGINFEVNFIGEGESRDYLESLINHYKLKDNVILSGSKSQDYLMTHLCDYDLFVQPSRYEGFGLTVAEAMAAKVPVLVSEGQGPAEVTENDVYGWFFINGDANSLIERITFIFNHYDECLRKVDKGREHVMNEFDVRITAGRYLAAYEEMLNKI